MNNSNIYIRLSAAVLLKGLKIVGGRWDATKKSIIKSEKLFNNLPPLLVHVINKTQQKATYSQQIQAYITHLRQCQIVTVNLNNNCLQEFQPYIVFDTGDEAKQSRQLQRPIQVSMPTGNSGTITPSQDLTERTMTTNKSQQLALAGQTIMQNLLKSNATLNQIREISTERFPAQESQLSFKPMSPNAPPLPPDLQTLVRSKPMDN